MQPSLDLLICECRGQSSRQARGGVGVVAVGIRTVLGGGPPPRGLTSAFRNDAPRADPDATIGSFVRFKLHLRRVLD